MRLLIIDGASFISSNPALVPEPDVRGDILDALSCLRIALNIMSW